MNVFDCAIKIEEETKAYYEGLEAEASDPEMKLLFSMLAASEDEHKKSLLKLKEGMSHDKARMDGLDIAACSYRPFLTQRELLEETDKDPDLYLYSIKREEQEIRFYEELANMAGDEPTRRSLLMLADEERRHLEMLENIYAFVEEPKSYLEWGEFSNLKTL